MASIGKGGNERATVKRLLDSAAREFAEHGYAATRVRDIVDAAGVNLAAVNYHFGGKEGLYRATLARLASRARDEMPSEAPGIRGLPPEEQLRVFARGTLVRYLGSGGASSASRIIAHELLDPTPACEALLRVTSGPQWARLQEIVSLMLGPRASEEDVALASMSVAGQWVFFLFGRRMFEFQFPTIAGKSGLIEQLADHIAAFSIAAIRARREQLEGARAPEAPTPTRVSGKEAVGWVPAGSVRGRRVKSSGTGK